MVWYLNPVVWLLLGTAFLLAVRYSRRRARMVRLIEKIPGPPSLPIIGNTIELNVEHDEIFSRIVSGVQIYSECKGMIRGWNGPVPWVLIYTADKAESWDFNAFIHRFYCSFDEYATAIGPGISFLELIADIKAPMKSKAALSSRCISSELVERLTGSSQLWGRRHGMYRAWLGSDPYVLIFHADSVEPILSSNKHIEKSKDYVYLRPWLGTGLLTSGGSKWHVRRKILTPAFHFKILEDFIDVFLEQSTILVEKLETEVGNMEGFNIFPYVTLCTLDIVCETAMGRHVGAQQNSDSEYVKAVYEIGSIVQNRQAKIWLQPDWLFKMTNLYKKHQNCIRILHGFSNKVIKERKEEIRKQKEQQNISPPSEEEDTVTLGRKKRLAFLDLLIEASRDGTELSNEDIREEVDTFMFEGHDTTSAAISWALFLLGSHPDIQDKVVEELDGILLDTERRLTLKDLHEMKYMECCIKEALRLYPSVPFIARELREDVNIAHYTIPAGTTALIVTYMLHRNPEIFPEPEKFNPDHFLPENIVGRHPYAYIPFSAGPRNCIGQKFALLEEKVVIASVLRKFRVESLDRREDLTLLGELILRPKHGLKVRIYPRSRSS